MTGTQLALRMRMAAETAEIRGQIGAAILYREAQDYAGRCCEGCDHWEARFAESTDWGLCRRFRREGAMLHAAGQTTTQKEFSCTQWEPRDEFSLE